MVEPWGVAEGEGASLLQPHARTAAVFGDELNAFVLKRFFHSVQGAEVDVLSGFKPAHRGGGDIRRLGKLANAPS